MKEIVFDEVSKIHVDDIKITDIVLVKKEGKAFGTIVYNSGYWRANSVNIASMNTDDLSEACRWFGAHCEFYIFE